LTPGDCASFSIKPGAALTTVAEIRMAGELGLGTKEEPNYMPTRVEGGNFIDTEDYFPFYKAVVEDIRFIARE